MKKKSFLRNAILLSLLVGATAVYSPAVMAAETVNEEAMEFAMEEYVVTASRTQTAKVDTPANVSTIDAAKIESRRYQDVAEALKDVPGAVVMDNGYGANEKNIILNGDDRVLVLVDGRRVNIDMGSTSGKSTFDLNLLPDVSQIERIEVVKGHGGALYGSDAVGGVINIITKKTDHSYGKVGFSAGSHKYKEGKALYNFKEGKTGVSVSTSKIKQSYYKYKDVVTGSTKRWPYGSDYENEKVALRIDQELTDTTNLSVGYNFSKFEGTSPASANAPASWTQRVSKKSNEFNAKYSWLVKDADEGYLQTYYKKYSYFNDGGMDEKDFGLELQQSITTSANNKLVVGASYRNSKAENAKAYDESSINNLAIFANNMWEFAPTWTLNTGARWDKHSKAGSKTTLSAGLNKKFDDNSHAYVNWGQVFKAPTIDDLYYYSSFTYEGTLYVSKGNPDLNPEKGETFTLGYGTKLNDKTDINVSYFYSDLKDAIDWDGYPISEVKNIHKQKKNGMELSINHELNDNWDLEASYTYVRVRNDNNDGAGFVRDLNYAPNNYRLGVRYHDEKWNADLMMRAASGADTTKAYIDSSYVTFDMAASYKATKDWTIFAKGYNLFNKAYAERAGVTGGRYDYPAQSRRFIVGAEYSF